MLKYIAWVAFIMFLFCSGYSIGSKKGYLEGYDEARKIEVVKYNEAMNRLNTYIAWSNDRQKELQQRAITAAEETQKWKDKYEEQLAKPAPLLPKEEGSKIAFSPSFVSAVNSLLRTP